MVLLIQPSDSRKEQTTYTHTNVAESQNLAGLKEARSQESTACIIPFIWNSKKDKSIVTEGKSVVA